MRLFLAVEPDRPAEAQIGRLLLDVQRALGDQAAALRWTPASNVHATLHFLGEVEPARAELLHGVLTRALDLPAFELGLGTLGVLPPTGSPRIVWLGVDRGQQPLTLLHGMLAERLREAGLAVEGRPFTPHLTLARVRDRERGRAKGLRERIQTIQPVPVSWLVDHVTLFRSDLSGPVPKYAPLDQLWLSRSHMDGSHT